MEREPHGQGWSGLSWRDKVLLANSVLFCVVGVLLVARYVTREVPGTMALLGVVFLAFGCYRLILARREMRKRKQKHG